MADPSASFRVILVGNSSCGKSSLCQRLVQNVFYTEHVPTLGVDFQRVTFTPDDTGAPSPISISVWDSAGQESFLSITQQFIRGADAAFLCFDVTDSKSYQNAINQWRDRVGQEKGGSIMLVLVGCKADLEGMRTVSKSEAAAFAAEKNIPYFETSAKENQNVRSTFAFVSKTLFDKKAASGAGNSGGGASGGGNGAGAAKVNLSARVSGPSGDGGDAGAGGAASGASAGGGKTGCRC